MLSVPGIVAAFLVVTTNLVGMLCRTLLLLDGPGMLIVALLDSSFFSIPEGNDLLIIGLSIGKAWSRVTYYIAMTTIGSILGCILLFTVGRRGGSPFLRRRLSARRHEWVEALFQKYGILALIVPCLLPPPCPFKIFVFSAGVFGVRLRDFMAAITLGRLARYSMWGLLAFQYGDKIKQFVETRLRVPGIVLVVLFAAALGVLAARYLRKTPGGHVS